MNTRGMHFGDGGHADGPPVRFPAERLPNRTPTHMPGGGDIQLMPATASAPSCRRIDVDPRTGGVLGILKGLRQSPLGLSLRCVR